MSPATSEKTQAAVEESELQTLGVVEGRLREWKEWWDCTIFQPHLQDNRKGTSNIRERGGWREGVQYKGI